MLSEKDYRSIICSHEFETTCKILEDDLAYQAEDLSAVRNYRPAIALLQAAQALKTAREKYEEAFRIMNGEE
jgi:hypothetical protein